MIDATSESKIASIGVPGAFGIATCQAKWAAVGDAGAEGRQLSEYDVFQRAFGARA